MNRVENINTPDTALESLTISQAKFAIPKIFGHLFEDYEYEREGHYFINNRHFDVYKVKADKTDFKFYEDITAFYGKGNIIPNLMERDLPTPNQPYPLDFVLGREYEQLKVYGAKRNIDLDKIKVIFKLYSSNMVSNYIAAFYPNRNEIDVTAIKEYHKTYDYPILHSFNLYKLFVLHQVIHILYNHDFYNTEIEIRGDYYQPKIGEDCISFTPISRRTHASEFINYMFWLHQPKAFSRDNEKSAFINSMLFGVQSKLFTIEDIIDSINIAKPDNETRINLITEIERLKNAKN